jgi:predicted oxidoreductase
VAALHRHLDLAGGPIIAVTHSVLIRSLTGADSIPHGSVSRYVPDLAVDDA